MLKAKHTSGFMHKAPVTQTHKKYFNILVQKGIITPTKNGFQLRHLRTAMTTEFGYQFQIIGIYDTVKKTHDIILGALSLNKLQQQKYAAKRYLETTLGRVVTKTGHRSLDIRLLAGDAKVMFSSRSLAKVTGMSHTTTNKIINRLEKGGMIKIKHSKNLFDQFEFNTRKFAWKCERFLLQSFKKSFYSCLENIRIPS